MLAFSLVHIPYVLAVCEAVVCKSLGETIHSGTLTKTHAHIHAHTHVHAHSRLRGCVSSSALWAELPGVWESSGVPCLYAVKQTLSHTDSSQVTNGLTAPVSDKLLGTLSPADLYTHIHTHMHTMVTNITVFVWRIRAKETAG